MRCGDIQDRGVEKILNEVLSVLETLMAGVTLSLATVIGHLYAQVNTEGLVDQILGPMGALALALVVLWLLYKYAKHQREKYDELQDKMMQEKDAERDRDWETNPSVFT